MTEEGGGRRWEEEDEATLPTHTLVTLHFGGSGRALGSGEAHDSCLFPSLALIFLSLVFPAII